MIYQVPLIKSIPEVSVFISVFTRNKLCGDFKVLGLKCEFTDITDRIQILKKV